MGRAIDVDNMLIDIKARIETLEGVVEELSNAFMGTDLHKDDFMPPAGKPKKTTKKVKEVEKV